MKRRQVLTGGLAAAAFPFAPKKALAQEPEPQQTPYDPLEDLLDKIPAGRYRDHISIWYLQGDQYGVNKPEVSEHIYIHPCATDLARQIDNLFSRVEALRDELDQELPGTLYSFHVFLPEVMVRQIGPFSPGLMDSRRYDYNALQEDVESRVIPNLQDFMDEYKKECILVFNEKAPSAAV